MKQRKGQKASWEMKGKGQAVNGSYHKDNSHGLQDIAYGSDISFFLYKRSINMHRKEVARVVYSSQGVQEHCWNIGLMKYNYLRGERGS